MRINAAAILLFFMLLPAAGATSENHFADPQDHKYPKDYHQTKAHPQPGQDILKYAEDEQKWPPENFGVQFVHDNEIFAVFFGDRLEYQTREGAGTVLWDAQAWVGTDYNKIWFKSEGEYETDTDRFEEAQTEVYYSRTMASFWDLQLGIRYDFKPDPERAFAALGVQGLAPLWFEFEATAYISEDGDVSAAFEAEYDILLSQRLILQPRFETGIAIQAVEEYGVGQGINDIELGLRLRYHIRREFAPYIGVSWIRKLGETADFAEEEGEDTSVFSVLAGVQFWF